MTHPYDPQDPNSADDDATVRLSDGGSPRFVIPLIAAVAIVFALVAGNYLMSVSDTQQAAAPAQHSSETGVGAGESGQGNLSQDGDAKSGAATTASPQNREKPAAGK